MGARKRTSRTDEVQERTMEGRQSPPPHRVLHEWAAEKAASRAN